MNNNEQEILLNNEKLNQVADKIANLVLEKVLETHYTKEKPVAEMAGELMYSYVTAYHAARNYAEGMLENLKRDKRL